MTVGVAPGEVNLPDVMAEVNAVFDACEQALVTNDIEVLDRLFWASAHTLRYGAAEHTATEVSALTSPG